MPSKSPFTPTTWRPKVVSAIGSVAVAPGATLMSDAATGSEMESGG